MCVDDSVNNVMYSYVLQQFNLYVKEGPLKRRQSLFF